MQHGGAPTDEAITSRERRFHVKVEVDWNNNQRYDHTLTDLSPYMSTIVVDRSLTGVAPEELLLIEGSSAAELSVTLGGHHDDLTMVAVFSPYNGFSPLYKRNTIGAEVRYQIGVETADGVTWYPQFIGNVRTITPDRATNTVTITALDRVEKLRRPVPLTAWAVMESYASRGIVASQLLESQWMIDNALRFCDTSATRYRPTNNEELSVSGNWDGVQFWLTGTGGCIPTIGWMDGYVHHKYPNTEATGIAMYQPAGAAHPQSPNPDTPPPALRAMGANGGDENWFWAADRDALVSGGTHWSGFTLVTTGPGSEYYLTAPDHMVLRVNPGGLQTMSIMAGAGKVWASYTNTHTGQSYTTSKVAIPTTAGPVRVRAAWDVTTQSGLRMRINAGPTGTGWETKGPGITSHPTDTSKGLIVLTRRISLNDIYYTARNVYGTGTAESFEDGRTASYVAVLDRGRNRLSFLPDRYGEEAWTLITEVAAAEFGAVHWDESGVFRFWNYDTILAKQNQTVRTLSLDDVSNLQITTSLDSVRNQWMITAKKRRMMSLPVYQARDIDEFYVPPHTFKRFRVWIGGVVTPNSAQCPRYSTVPGSPYPQWSDDVEFGYVVQFNMGGTWQEYDPNSSGVDLFSYRDSSGATIIDVFNGYPQPVRFATNAGRPALRWNGSMVTEFDDQIFQFQDVTSVKKYGGRTLPLASDWHHETYHADGMITALLARTAEPIPATDAITIAGDPRLQLGDCIQIRDDDGLGETIGLQIYGIRRTYDIDNGLTDRLTVEMLKPPGQGTWDSRQYGRWDTSLTWS